MMENIAVVAIGMLIATVICAIIHMIDDVINPNKEDEIG